LRVLVCFLAANRELRRFYLAPHEKRARGVVASTGTGLTAFVRSFMAIRTARADAGA
jgi:hypothetical protein